MALSLARTSYEAGNAERVVPVVERLLADQAEDPQRSSALLLSLGADVLLEVGRVEEAERMLVRAMGIVRDLGDELGAAQIDHALARVDIRRGDLDRARDRLAGALRVDEGFGVQEDVARTLATMGDLELVCGRPDAAAEVLRRSLAIWQDVGARLEIARTSARLALCDPDAADLHRTCCRTILDDLGLTDRALRLPESLQQPPASD